MGTVAVRALRPKGHHQPGPGDPLPADFLQQRAPDDPTFPTVHKLDAMIALLLTWRDYPDAVREIVDRMWLDAHGEPAAEVLRGDGPVKRRWVMLIALENAYRGVDAGKVAGLARQLQQPPPTPKEVTAAILETRVLTAHAFIERWCPGRVHLDVLRPAVEHYRTHSRAKWPALHDLARALRCDMPRRREETSGQYAGEDPLRTTLWAMAKKLRESSKP
jgi:hypothetical protein